ncbi:hypothetical protein AC578_1365 [Pseudocercospora eumusae]|uniref:Uncharacterized protein n=1 Tax=Pseudocercospora eumusae TaxID=321146 RepID=A0A139HUH7_9PEZI|nr:hypothetical protein AC578_1365 [Pseudocercospora eumusae]
MSTYLHSSLYSFSERAREKILHEFIDIVRDVSVDCCYNADTDTFEIRCPSSAIEKGGHADEVLSKIIQRHIDEYEEKEDQSGDDDDLVRFAESKFDAVDNFESNPDHSRQSRPSEARPVARSHIIIANAEKLKVFRLRDLDEFGFLERTLAPANKKMESLFECGVTCRAARFDSNDGYVFNGRTGKNKLITNGGTLHAAPLQLPEFGILSDDRMMSNEPPQSIAGNQWEMEDADQSVGVNKWLLGVGRTLDSQINPNVERPDVPKDTKQMLAKEQTHATSRARVPKGAAVVSSDLEDSDEEDDESTVADFSEFLASNRFAQAAQANQELDDSGSETSHRTEKGPSFASLLPGGKLTPQKRRDSGDWSAVIPKPSHAALAQSSDMQSWQRASPSKASTANDDGQWADYGGRYAARDKIGLKGNADALVSWDRDNYQPDQDQLQRHAKKKLVAIRGATPSIPSTPLSISGKSTETGQGTSGCSARLTSASISGASSTVAAKPIRCYADWDPSEADWKNVAAPATTNADPKTKLIDDRAFPSSTPIKPPPGYLHQEPDAEVRVTNPDSLGDLMDSEENVMDEEPENVRPSAFQMTSRPKTTLAPTQASTNGTYASTAAMREAAPNTSGTSDLPPSQKLQLPSDYTSRITTKKPKK